MAVETVISMWTNLNMSWWFQIWSTQRVNFAKVLKAKIQGDCDHSADATVHEMRGENDSNFCPRERGTWSTTNRVIAPFRNGLSLVYNIMMCLNRVCFLPTVVNTFNLSSTRNIENMQMRPTLYFITRYTKVPSAKCLQLSFAPRPLTNGSTPPCAHPSPTLTNLETVISMRMNLIINMIISGTRRNTANMLRNEPLQERYILQHIT